MATKSEKKIKKLIGRIKDHSSILITCFNAKIGH